MSLPLELEENLAKALVNCEPRTDKEIIAIVEDVLNDMGLDHMHWEEVQALKKDLSFVRETRLRCEDIKSRTIWVAVSVVVIGVVTILVLGFKEWFSNGIR